MKTILSGAFALASVCAFSPSDARAAQCRVRVATSNIAVASTSLALIPKGFIAVPFAVPVATPSYVTYQAVPQVVPKQQQPAAAMEAESKPPHSAQDAPAGSLVQQHCVKCHSGDEPKAGLDATGWLDSETRLKMIRRVLADDKAKRMPRGKDLDPTTIGMLIQDLSQEVGNQPPPPTTSELKSEAGSVKGYFGPPRPRE